MERRKLLIGVGSLAAGGAAAIGTGAVETISADRTLDVEVADDANAYLGIEPNTDSQFVEEESGMVAIDFASDTTVGGNGVNNDAYTEVRPAFHLVNQSSNTLFVDIRNVFRNNDISSSQNNNDGFSGGGTTVPAGIDLQFIASGTAPNFDSGDVGLIGRDNAPAAGSNFGTPSDPSTISLKAGTYSPYNFQSDSDAGYVELAPGDKVPITVRVVTDGYDTSNDSFPPTEAFVVRAVNNESNTNYNTNLSDNKDIPESSGGGSGGT